ncbi:MAG: hypothetical protein ACOCQ4_01815 [bacterium]
MEDKIINWFGNSTSRREIIKHFNQSAKKAYLSGEVETLFKANITVGEADYSHRLSKFFMSGFRIKAITGKFLSEDEITKLGHKILKNNLLVRMFMTLGWDTLYLDNADSDYFQSFNIQNFSED